MSTKFARLQPRLSTGRSPWMIAGAALVALCVWVPLALAAPGNTSASAPANTQPPQVLGTAKEGQVLRANPGVWRGTKPMTFSFQWQVCDTSGCANVQTMKATDRIYAIPRADVGKSIRVVVTASNQAGSASMPSTVTAPVTAAPATNAHNTALPQISGTARAGQTLVAQPGQWIAPGPIRFLYQWRSCRRDGGACEWTHVTTRTYTLKASDLGDSFRVLVRAWSQRGPVTPANTSAALSDPTASVGPLLAPVNTSAPTISGKAEPGELLTAHRGSWRGTQPISFRYQWLRCDQNGANCQTLIGATQYQFKLSDKDIGHRLRVQVTGVNRFGRTEAMSGATDLVKAKPVPGPANTQTPTISGTAVVGATLTADPGKWQGQGSITFSYQWARCDTGLKSCPPIGGATHSTYTITSGDVGHRLLVQVTARNPGGISVASSSPTAVVQASKPPPPPPAIKGTMSISQVSLPDRLVVDRLQFSPSRITSRSQPVIARFHVAETQNGRPVQGALVYATGVPYNRLSNQPEAVTGSDGWATITFRVLPTFQLRPGNLVVMFVRARKPGENPLAGVSNRRLVSVAVG